MADILTKEIKKGKSKEEEEEPIKIEKIVHQKEDEIYDLPMKKVKTDRLKAYGL
jgi:hypothetical protein